MADGGVEPMSAILDKALTLADMGLPVFPLLADKSPACAGGFKAATTDPAENRPLFSNFGAVLIGVPTGPRSKLAVLDIDAKKGGDQWLAEHKHRLPTTRCHHTRSIGGQHFLFRHVEGLRCSESKIARGVDICAAGGY